MDTRGVGEEMRQYWKSSFRGGEGGFVGFAGRGGFIYIQAYPTMHTHVQARLEIQLNALFSDDVE